MKVNPIIGQGVVKYDVEISCADMHCIQSVRKNVEKVIESRELAEAYNKLGYDVRKNFERPKSVELVEADYQAIWSILNNITLGASEANSDVCDSTYKPEVSLTSIPTPQELN